MCGPLESVVLGLTEPIAGSQTKMLPEEQLGPDRESAQDERDVCSLDVHHHNSASHFDPMHLLAFAE